MTSARQRRLLLALITAVAVITGVGYSVYARSDTDRNIQAEPVVSERRFTGRPAVVIIPSLGLLVSLEAGIYNPETHSWNLSTVNGQYAKASAQPNLYGGNTVLYGHNSRRIFGRLPQLAPGAQVILETDNHLKFYYQLSGVEEVQPTDVSVLNYRGTPILTIQTCSGNWNERRQMFRFSLQRLEINPKFDSLD